MAKVSLNDIYEPLVSNKAKDFKTIILHGGAGSGKTNVLAYLFVHFGLTLKKKNILIARQYKTSASDSIWRDVLSVISQLKVEKRCKINKTTKTIEFSTGTVLMCRGLLDREKLKSLNLYKIWVDEATESDHDTILQLITRIRQKGESPQLFLSFNPVSKSNYIYRDYFAGRTYRKWKKHPRYNVDYTTKTLTLHTTAYDNYFIPKTYIESLEQLTDERHKAVYLRGEWGTTGKLVYSNWQKKPAEEVRKIARKYPKSVGSDIGYSLDLTTGIAIAYDKQNKRLYVYDEVGGAGWEEEDISREFKKHDFHKQRIIMDSSEPRLINSLKSKYGLNVKGTEKYNGSVMALTTALQGLKEIIVADDCLLTIEMFENLNFKLDKRTGVYINEINDDRNSEGYKHNDTHDALRYAFERFLDKAKGTNGVRTMPKSILGI